MSVTKHWEKMFAALIVGSLILSACSTATPQVIEKVVTQVVKETVIVEGTPQVVEKEVTKIVEVEKVVTATPSPKGPSVGGKLVWAIGSEPDTLDEHKTSLAAANVILGFLGATLTAKDPDGKIVPYLAESWKSSKDGLTWEFTLKKGIKFHDGTPMTAADYAWTFQRLLDPDTKSPIVGSLGPLESVEAVDDYTLQLTLKEPYFPLLASLASAYQPLSRTAIEEGGDLYGHSPMGVGPYKFKEWQVGNKVVLERNPDFAWGPDFTHDGPFYIQTIEFRFVPEAATIMAGLETGEIDYADEWAFVEAKDIPRLRDMGKFQIFTGIFQGMRPYVAMNLDKPPFDDVRVRKAFNLAVNREALIKVILQGNGVPLWGPMSPSQIGYWSGVEDIGYGYDLEQAKALMNEAGFTMGSSGLLEKDGEPLKLEIKTFAIDIYVKTCEVLKEQFKELGVELNIMQQDVGIHNSQVLAGDYHLAAFAIGWPEADVLYMLFHSSQIGALNSSQTKDPELDKILEKTRTETDSTKRQEWVNEAQKNLVENAVVVPLFALQKFVVLNNQVQGAVWSPEANLLYLNDAYIEE